MLISELRALLEAHNVPFREWKPAPVRRLQALHTQVASGEVVYLAFNVENHSNVTESSDKDVLDGNKVALSADLYGYDEMKKYQETFEISSSPSRGGVTRSQYLPLILIQEMYLVVPSRYTAKLIETMINKGLGDRDMSFRAPEIGKVF